ncbi:hypothetical protein QRX25_10395 [Bacillus sp. L381]|uniref:hypothetical protein n=1 Tax=Bacillus TaxID=1386 RepID=UPI001BA704D3|nr:MULTISPECIES: hypothetical protein [Bacillus]MCR9040953.1 hypothetical protein [Bacillus velezensis]QUN07963.1 hypothetical protein KEF49_10250 [Bacillus amyloliquefaciens]QYM81029.1 hypothetical protein KTJ85_10100 [Bacillus sp. 7D3]QZY10176.1 hypothetical protein K7B13_10325 [Bacillus amyloliquefaciens]QZY11086.1 hypothetical protein K7B13_15325 [Bacillus amyloliquefaciens]
MNVREIIVKSLKPLGVPVEFLSYKGKDDTYIRFFFYNQRPAFSAEDEESVKGHYVQIDIFTKNGNEFSRLEKEVPSKLKAAGFTFRNQYDDYEHETEIYHKILRFFYAQNTEEE